MDITKISRVKEALTGRAIRLWLLLRVCSIVVGSLALVYGLHGNPLPYFKTLVISPWYSYDAEYYVRIVRNGYRAGDNTSGFHPLYPWLARGLAQVIHDPLLSLLIVSSLAGAILAVAFYRFALIDTTRDRAWSATALFLCWPISLAIFAPYTEATHLLFAVLCLTAARQKRFWLAGIAGGLVALTRQHGLFLAVPIAWELWEAADRKWRNALNNWYRWTAVLLVPLGYALWILYRAYVIDDVKPDLSSPQSFIFSVMVSPTAYKIYQEQQFLPPWVAIWKAAAAFWRGGLHWSAYGDIFLAMLFVAMFAFGWRHLRLSYRLYSLAIVIIALSYHTGTQINPYISLPRHLLPAFPIFLGVSIGYKFRRLGFVLLALIICQQLYLCCFVWESWVL